MAKQNGQSSLAPFNRPPRARPKLPDNTVHLPALPVNTETSGRSWMTLVPPLLMAGTLLVASTLINSGRAALYFIPMVAVAVVTAGFSAVQIIRERRVQQRKNLARQQEYQAALAQVTLRLEELKEKQRQVRLELDPEPEILLHIVGVPTKKPQSRLWERRPEDPDFLAVRVGLGSLPSTVKIESGHFRELDSVASALIERFQTVENVPITLGLRAVGSIGLAGPRAKRTELGHALLWSLVTHHAPVDLRVAALCQLDENTKWEWLTWIPHTLPINGDAHHRMIAQITEDGEVERLLIKLLDELSRRREHTQNSQSQERSQFLPHIVVLVDGNILLQRQTTIDEIIRNGRAYGMTAIILKEQWDQIPGDCGAIVEVTTNGADRYMCAGGEWQLLAQSDKVNLSRSKDFGAALRRVQLAEGGANQEIPRNVRLLDLLEVRDTADLTPPALWSQPPQDAWHADVPIGQAAHGELVYLDLREHHHGPHGIIAGTTGAGKSELLQAIIASLAITHAPDQAQFLLIDFKGGASLRIFEHLPHTVGLVTDLQGTMAERAMTAIKSEIRRRKELLNSVDAKDIATYRMLDHQPEVLANLMIVIDEFDEMVKEQPDFVTELIRVVKQGRSLGVHLLLATQQPSRAVNDEIKSQLQYWITLRVGSAEDSREMLQRTEAFFLPTGIPGRGYMRVGTSLTLFQAPRVNGPYEPRSDEPKQTPILGVNSVGTLEPLKRNARSSDTLAAPLEKDSRRTDLQVIVSQLQAIGESYVPARRTIWCPPLPNRLTLTQVLQHETLDAIQAERWWQKLPNHLRPAIGLLDVPQESRQQAFEVDLYSGHVLVVGAPGSGKTVLLRSLLMSLAVTEHPADLWCYLIDAGGQGLNVFQTMPHLGGLVQVREIERVRRVLWMLRYEVQRRQEQFRVANVPDLGTYRRETGQRLPALLLVIDKFALFREEHEPTVEDLIGLARIGRAYGVHLVITADRPNDIPFRLFGLLEHRLVLRVNEEGDSVTLMSKRSAARLPASVPGRGFRLVSEQGWLEFQVALPFLERGQVSFDENETSLLDAEVNASTRRVMEHLQALWQTLPLALTHSAAPIRLLPEFVAYSRLQAEAIAATALENERPEQGLRTLLGMESQSLGVTHVQLTPSRPVFVAIGGPRSGKTVALRTMLLSLVQQYSPDSLRLALVDPRNGSFRDFQALPHTALYASTEVELAAMAEKLNIALQEHTPGQRWVVCIDDYEIGASLMQGQFSKPFSPTTTKTFLMMLEAISSVGRNQGFTILIGTSLSTPIGFVAQMAAARTGIIMRPNDFPAGTNLFGVKLPIVFPGGQPPTGRGILVIDGVQQLVQVALADEDDTKQVFEDMTYERDAGTQPALHPSLA